MSDGSRLRSSSRSVRTGSGGSGTVRWVRRGLVDQPLAQRRVVVAEQRLEAADRLVQRALRHVVARVGGQSLERGLGLGDEPVAPALPRGAHDGRLSHVRRRTTHGSRWR